MGSTEPLDPLKLLQDELKDDDYEQVIKSIRRVSTIARAIGPERVRKELIPYLTEISDSDNDEAHTVVATQLQHFIPLVGGVEHISACLPLLEKYCTEEEVVVREAAVNSLNVLVSAVSADIVAAHFLPLITRLCSGSWFAKRVSCAGLVSATYRALEKDDTASREKLRKIFTELADDETPMVKRSVYVRLGEYAQTIKPFFKSDILPIMRALTRDPTDTMRLLIVDVIVSLKDVLAETEFETTIVPLLEVLEDDTSWRVRKALVEALDKICQSVSQMAALKSIIPLFVKLLADKESQVRQSAAKMLSSVGNEVKGSDVLLVEALEPLSTDVEQGVRLHLAKTIVGYCESVKPELLTKSVLPVIRALAKDDNYEVRSQILENVEKLPEAAFLGLLPLLMELATDPKWRVRVSVMKKCSVLAKILGPRKFADHIQAPILAALSDHMFAIREEACNQIALIVAAFGGKWASEGFFKEALKIYDKNSNYLYRMTCLHFILKSVEYCDADICEKFLLPAVIPAATDDVANVKIQFSRTVSALVPKLKSAVVQRDVTPLLVKLTEDSDRDVRFFSKVCIEDHGLASIA